MSIYLFERERKKESRQEEVIYKMFTFKRDSESNGSGGCVEIEVSEEKVHKSVSETLSLTKLRRVVRTVRPIHKTFRIRFGLMVSSSAIYGSTVKYYFYFCLLYYKQEMMMEFRRGIINIFPSFDCVRSYHHHHIFQGCSSISECGAPFSLACFFIQPLHLQTYNTIQSNLVLWVG
jgi:hypothetical protein